MHILFIIILVIAACFSLVVFFGAPYVPTLKKQVETALDLVDLQPGQTLLELGCGDGRVMIAAAQRGWQVVGYELNPILVLICRLRTWRHRKHVRVIWGNFLVQRLPKADAIFIFGLSHTLAKLDKKIMQSENKHVKLVSFAYEIPGKKIAQTKDGIHLYRYQ